MLNFPSGDSLVTVFLGFKNSRHLIKRIGINPHRGKNA